MTTMKKFHWFWAWEDEKEEAWLREMSQQGWHLKTYQIPSNYTFEKGDPVDYVYRLDYFTDQKDIKSYLQIFNDAGWNHLGDMWGWQYFRKETINGEAPEIYSDNESKKKKYQRLLLFLVIFFPIYTNVLFMTNSNSSIFIKVITFVMIVLLVIIVYAMVKLLHRIFQLNKKI